MKEEEENLAELLRNNENKEEVREGEELKLRDSREYIEQLIQENKVRMEEERLAREEKGRQVLAERKAKRDKRRREWLAKMQREEEVTPVPEQPKLSL